ncbi:MAG: hypothetical protein D6775_07845 [Caldilineae bacterium]|nr:MAG: hypothetical protein D6775_07845 [Caldilineae bacterium]
MRQRFLAPRDLALLSVLLLVAVLGLWLLRRENAVSLGPQQVVQTTNPKAGVHTRLENEVEAWKIKRTLEMVREMGTPWIVEYFPWAFSEPRKGSFRFDHADLVVDHANRQGLTVIARLGLVPEWARPRESISTYLDPEHYDDFAAYAAAFADHFSGRVRHIIIWNEPNLSLEWGYRPPDPQAYSELLCRSAEAIRQVAPDVVILGGALAPTTGDPEGDLGIGDLEFLEGMYGAGAGPCFDALAAHAYGLTFPPDDPPDPEVINFRRVELLRQVMVRNGDGDKPIYITESGWNDHPRWTRAVRPAQRIRYTLQAYDMAREWPWLQVLAMWAFRYPWPEHNVRDYYTFVTPDFQPKPIYLELQKALLSGASPTVSR